MNHTGIVTAERSKEKEFTVVQIPLLLFDLAYRSLKKMRGDLKRFWGILSGKPAQRQPRLRSTSLPRITSYGLIGFGTYEYIPKSERLCSPLWYDYDNGKLCNTFPRRTKQKSHGRERSVSVSVEVTNSNGSGNTVQPRRGSTTKHFKVDIDETIKEDEVLDIDELKRVLTSFHEVDEKGNQGTLTTDLCSTEL
jgi:hypothetical protein